MRGTAEARVSVSLQKGRRKLVVGGLLASPLWTARAMVAGLAGGTFTTRSTLQALKKTQFGHLQDQENPAAPEGYTPSSPFPKPTTAPLP